MHPNALGAAVLAFLFVTAGGQAQATSISPAFDQACTIYYSQNNDPDIQTPVAAPFCACLAQAYEDVGLRRDALDFFARTYSEDLTAFIQDYSSGEAWMDESFRAEAQCKTSVAGARPGEGNAGIRSYPREGGSWGGIVRAGPGQEHTRLDSLAEGERVTLLESTGIMFNGYPWLRIRYRGEREGYQWGGILCSVGEPFQDVFEVCP